MPLVETSVGMAGDADFADLYQQLFARALRTAASLLAARDGAEEIAAETMARAYVHWGNVVGHAPAWVTRVAANLALDQLRRKPVYTTPSPKPPDEALERVAFRQRVAGLPRRQREVLALRYLVDLDEADTARVLGLSVTTVRTHTRRALDHLRRGFDAGGRFDET